MKILRTFVIMLLALLIGACASTSQDLNYADKEPGLKEKYVYAINRDAQTRATRVYWVNYPTDEEVAERFGKDDDDS